MKHFYAMMVDLTSVSCLVVGGGPVAERKIASLVEAGAKVEVVSPTATPFIQKWARDNKIKWRSAFYTSTDGADCSIVIAATNSLSVNRQVYHDAKERGQWINVVDQPNLCNFTVPSTVKRGKLQISISTNGVSPSLAKKIRRELEVAYGGEYSFFLDLMQELRETIQTEVSDATLRYQLMKELVSDRWIEECRRNPSQVKDLMHKWINQQILVGK